MSSLWTPGGERPVPRAEPTPSRPPSSGGGPGQPAGGAPGGGGQAGTPPGGGHAGAPPNGGHTGGPDQGGPGGADQLDRPLTPEEIEMQAELAEVQGQLLAAPPEVVVANHAFGLFQLAALHLSQERPDWAAARLAIDAMSALVEGLAGRLGEVEAELQEGVAQIRLAFVQVQAAHRVTPTDGAAPA